PGSAPGFSSVQLQELNGTMAELKLEASAPTEPTMAMNRASISTPAMITIRIVWSMNARPPSGRPFGVFRCDLSALPHPQRDGRGSPALNLVGAHIGWGSDGGRWRHGAVRKIEGRDV